MGEIRLPVLPFNPLVSVSAPRVEFQKKDTSLPSEYILGELNPSSEALKFLNTLQFVTFVVVVGNCANATIALRHVIAESKNFFIIFFVFLLGKIFKILQQNIECNLAVNQRINEDVIKISIIMPLNFI